MSYETFISVNKKWIPVEETDTEHEERVKRLRRAIFAQKMEEERKKKGIVKGVTTICKKCGNQYPYSTIAKYNECPKCSILSMYN